MTRQATENVVKNAANASAEIDGDSTGDVDVTTHGARATRPAKPSSMKRERVSIFWSLAWTT